MHRIAFALASIFSILVASTAWAQSEVVITQAKALAGNVTPGDTAGYPVTLSQPGAYVLGSNLTVPNNQYGIFLGADNIDLDLNGFLITGNGVGTFGVVSNRAEGRIRNGVINRFRYSGIYLRNNAWTIEDMQIVRNGSIGVDATGVSFFAVRNTLVTANRGDGVRAGANTRIETSDLSSNSGSGVFCGFGCYVANSTLNSNLENGVRTESHGGIVIGNTISANDVGVFAYFDNGLEFGPRQVNITNNTLVLNKTAIVGGVRGASNICGSALC